jgi:hypothetical protein
MQHQHKKYATPILAFGITLAVSLACRTAGSPAQSPPPPVTQVVAVTQIVPVTRIVPVTQIVPAGPAMLPTPGIVLNRLGVSFLGQDGHKVIGSGCPGTDGKGTIVDYHILVSNVDEDKMVQRIIVTGDNSTLTWEWPCHTAWALLAKDLGNGIWDVFIAPSEASMVYTVMVFYEDNAFALGMSIAR